MSSLSTSQLLRERGAATWSAAVSHSMVTEIGAGTLPHPTFRSYFEQNVLYLEDYARAIALIIARAPGREAVAVLTRFLSQIVEVELPANYSFLSRLGGTAASGGDAAMLPTNYAYTRHLLDAAGEITTGLATALPRDPIYAEWISMFAGDEYGKLVDATTGLLDQHSDAHDEAQMASLFAVFDRSTRYELAFWDMAYTAG
jgi:thiaminase/transcriptional activator TenA